MIVSIIIPTRNRVAFLQQALASIQGQTYTNWETIIVDDASTDGTCEWLRGLRDSRVQIIHLEEHGERSAARNCGLARAKGEAVLFLDDDDCLEANALSRLSSELEKSPEAIACVGGRMFFDDSGS